ncbi:MAG TPA: hypothetical protein VFI27_17970 [candidate division Zixibacteria bacterium]|nr:hypothetical protein [candidate division Zixibacteria bacterium]
MHAVMLRFLGELTSRIAIDVDERTPRSNASGGEPIREVARHHNTDKPDWEAASTEQSEEPKGSY